MRFAGDRLFQEFEAPIPYVNPYDNPGNIRVDMQQEGLATPKAIFPTGEVAPAFEHPMMDPRRGPSHRDLWQYKQLIDERSPVPVL